MKPANDWAREYIERSIKGGKMAGVNLTELFREVQREAFDAGALAVIHAMETRGVTFKLEKALVDLVPATLEGRP